MAVKNIVILDDHELFRNAISTLLSENYTSIIINQFSEPESALEYILQCKKTNQAIDLIITDQVHQGIDGFEFATLCRSIENVSPILLLSMTVDDTFQTEFVFSNNISPDNPFNLCLPKSIEKNKLLDCISALIK